MALRHNQISEEQHKQKLLASALARLQSMQRRECFDPLDPESRPTATQEQVIQEFGVVKHQYLRAGNQSGKTTLCCRIISWCLADQHPTWKHPNYPILCIVAGRTGKQIEDSLLPRILAYLEPGSYKIIRIGNMTQRLEMDNGDRVVFQSLENAESARERLQSYTADIAWVDELPPTLDIISELHTRVQARNGQFLASFTPLKPSYEIQRYIDSVEESQAGFARVYRLRMLDNPIYASEEKKSELLRTLENLPENKKNSKLYGDWLAGDESVYSLDPAVHFRELPGHYSPTQWRHVVSVDPAMSSDTGLTVWAEDPRSTTGIWYNVLAEYIAPTHDPVNLVHQITRMTSKYNVVRRVVDPGGGGVWFVPIAWREVGISYSATSNKSGRKDELIAQFQVALGTRIYLTQKYSGLLVREMQNCRYSDQVEGKIVNASSMHLGDSAQYFVDNIPSPETQGKLGLMGDGIQARSMHEWIYKANDQRKLAEGKKREQAERKLSRISGKFRITRRGR